ncbi:MAG TPA: TIR domain-containing protein [Actinophytocola sp.]|uniref:TIR domain-containing protein n=1 Tax=Actinophytocola sp. TaxID=1872138 RepID=UPI002F939D04
MRVFLSHRTESEGPLARRLSGDLERRGIATWVAPRDVDPGSTWAQSVEAGLRTCTHVAALLTDDALYSGALDHELRVAEMRQLDGQAVLVPVLLERVDLPVWPDATPGVDFTGAYEDGLDALAETLRHSAAAAAPVERPIVHRVRRGDRIDLLAARYLGDPAHWRLIAEQNPGLDVSALEPGTLVSIRTRGR